MLADRGGRIESVEVIYPDRRETTPSLNVRFMELDIEEVNSLLGLSLSPDEIKDALEKMRFSCEILDKKLEGGNSSLQGGYNA